MSFTTRTSAAKGPSPVTPSLGWEAVAELSSYRWTCLGSGITLSAYNHLSTEAIDFQQL